MSNEIVVTEYDYDAKETRTVATVSTYLLAKCLTPALVAEILGDWLNSFENAIKRGQFVGKNAVTWHRSLQGLLVNFALGILVGFAQEYQEQWGGHTDPRNETAVKAASKVKDLIEDKTIPWQPFI